MNRVNTIHGQLPSTSANKLRGPSDTGTETDLPLFMSRLSPHFPKNIQSLTNSSISGGGSNRFCRYCSSPSTSFDAFCPVKCISSETSSTSSTTSSTSNTFESMSSNGSKSKIFPSTRFFIAILLCFCFISLSISTSNLSVSMVCMIRKPASVVATVRREYSDNNRALLKGRPTEARELSYPFNILKRVQNSSGRPPHINSSEQRHLNAEIMRLKRSLVANTTKWEVGNMSESVKESDALITKSTTEFINSTGIIEEILQVLERIGLDNATLQYRAKDSVEPQPMSSSNAFVTTVPTPLRMCQLARFRKHAHSYSEFWTDEMADNELNNPDEKNFQGLKRGISSEDVSGNGHLTVTIESCYESGKLDWSSTDQGIVFAAQNAGSLLMLFTGAQADRLNSKWTIVVALLLLILSNVLLPVFATSSVWLVVAARVLTGFSDALLQPSTSSMITRWFPPKERPFAVGLITGGRQIGTLMILPVAGFLCSRHDIMQGWPAIFYLSALIGSLILVVWLFMAADKPSKHFCTSHAERFFVEQKISEENLGKRTQRRTVPWREILHCRPFYIGVAALICHEYPLVIMLQLLPKYINDVLKFSITTNGIVSALPIAVLFVSKTLSSSLSSLIGARKKGRFLVGRTSMVKIFNAVASLGLGVCVAIVPLLNSENQKVMAIIVLCFANAFAGLHTPGVQTALLQLAPAYTGIITGIAFGFVAIFGIINKVLSNYIVQSGTINEWTIVFWIAAVVAILPVGFFSLWGSADRQPWATNNFGSSTSCPTIETNKISPINFMNRVYTVPSDINRPKSVK